MSGDGLGGSRRVQQAVAVGALLALVVYLGVFWSPPGAGTPGGENATTPTVTATVTQESVTDTAADTVTATATVTESPTATDTPQTRPQAAFRFAYNATAEEVAVLHAGGDTFSESNTGQLRVVAAGAGVRTNETWALPVAAGDRITVPARPGTEVLIFWTPPDGGRTEVIEQFVVEESSDSGGQ